jgi:indolepyruvate ferredoxin oxidoreductase beta subunit
MLFNITKETTVDNTVNILLVGVGGQGIVSSSDIISDMALARGFDVKKSEIHGMSQRGGVVYSYVRYGKKVHSPLPQAEDINYIASFEEMEILRWEDYINKETKVIVNTQQIKPATLARLKMEYPDVQGLLKHEHVKYIDAVAAAKNIGNEKFVSSVMTGALCTNLGFTEDEFRASFSGRVGKYIEENIKAFNTGREMAK